MGVDTIASIMDRFPYLNADVSEKISPLHPQLIYEHCNKVDDKYAESHAKVLNDTAHRWAELPSPHEDPEFVNAVDGMLSMLKAVSATSLLIIHCGTLLSERPGVEVDNKRKKEISARTHYILDNWNTVEFEERLSLSRLALMGVTPLHIEIVNYISTVDIPIVLGRMLSRLDILSRENKCDQIGTYRALKEFLELEEQILQKSNLERTSIPSGTWPRIYVPGEAICRDEDVFEAASRELRAGGNREEAMVGFLRLVWNDFADEAFLTIHENNTVHAYSLVGGCCFYYKGELDDSKEKLVMRSDAKPIYIETAGNYRLTPWRRTYEKLCFDGAGPELASFRKNLIELEATSVEERKKSANSGFIKKAAERLLFRQINYNLTSVLNKHMHRLTVDEWAPYMCRDRYGKVYNPPHAYGGVGDMFRGLLKYGGRFTQFRCWREVDETYSLADMRQFRGYRDALDAFLFQSEIS